MLNIELKSFIAQIIEDLSSAKQELDKIEATIPNGNDYGNCDSKILELASAEICLVRAKLKYKLVKARQ